MSYCDVAGNLTFETEPFQASFASRFKNLLMGPREQRAVIGGDFEQEVEIFFGRLKGNAEPAFCEGYTEESLRLTRLIPRAVKLLVFYIIYGAFLANGCGIIIWSFGSVLLKEPGVTFHVHDECINPSRRTIVLVFDYLRQVLCFGVGLIPPLLTLPWHGHEKRMAAMILFNQGGALLMGVIHTVVLQLTNCRMQNYAGMGYGEATFVLNLIGTVAIGCFPYGWRAFGLMLLAILLGVLPGYFCLSVLVPAFEMDTSLKQLLVVALVQGFFFMPRILMPRVARCFYQIVPGLNPCRTYAMGAIVAMLGSAAMRVLQAGLEGTSAKVTSAILTGCIEVWATMASPYADAAISIVLSRKLSVPPVAFYSPYRRRAMADAFTLMDVFEFGAIILTNMVWPATLKIVFDSSKRFKEFIPQLVQDSLAVLLVHSIFILVASVWSMRVDNLPLARARLGERRRHFAAVAFGTWLTTLTYSLLSQKIVIAVCKRVNVNLVALCYIVAPGTNVSDCVRYFPELVPGVNASSW